MQFLPSDNSKVLTFLRTYDAENILVIANLSRQSQAVRLQMPSQAGFHVRDMFSGNEFPRITEAPYIVTLTPYAFYWFTLERPVEPARQELEHPLEVQSDTAWEELPGSAESQLLPALGHFVRRARWFGGKRRNVRELRIADRLVVPTSARPLFVLLLEVTYADASRENYLVPIGFADGALQAKITKESAESIIAQVRLGEHAGILYDATVDEELHRILLDMIARGRSRKTDGGRALAWRGRRFGAILGDRTLPLPSQVLRAEQSNTSIIYQDTFFLKLHRRLEEGINPDAELSRYLTEETTFAHVPAYVGGIGWQRERSSPVTIALLLQFVPNQGDAWSFALDNIGNSLSHALTLKGQLQALPELPAAVREMDPESIPAVVRDFIGPVYLEMMSLLGRRTGELHLALMSLSQSPDVTPEPFSLLYQKSLYQSIRGLTLKVLNDLEGRLASLEAPTAEAVKGVLANRKTILLRVRRIIDKKIQALKIRTHGDYHLGQVLYTGKDFVIIDFEGEPARSLTERRLKQSALRDVAAMVRSFHYAAQASLILRADKQSMDLDYLRHWADLWYFYVSGMFLQAYRRTVADSQVVPTDPADFAALLETFILEKAVYELGYELNHRPDWLMIPVRGIEQILK
jgi:maltose alpha-D-glucosyltransferase/alpha-amylase